MALCCALVLGTHSDVLELCGRRITAGVPALERPLSAFVSGAYLGIWTDWDVHITEIAPGGECMCPRHCGPHSPPGPLYDNYCRRSHTGGRASKRSGWSMSREGQDTADASAGPPAVSSPQLDGHSASGADSNATPAAPSTPHDRIKCQLRAVRPDGGAADARLALVLITDNPRAEISRQGTIAHAVLGQRVGDCLIRTALALRWPLGSLFAVGWFLAHKGLASADASVAVVGSFLLMAPLALLCALTGNAGLAALELRRQVTLLHLHLFLLALYLPAAAAAVSFDVRTLLLCAIALCSAALLLLDTVPTGETLPRFHHLTVAVASVELIVWFDVALHLSSASPAEQPSVWMGPHHTMRPLEFVHSRTAELCLLTAFALFQRWRNPHALVYTSFLATTAATAAAGAMDDAAADTHPGETNPASEARQGVARGPASIAAPGRHAQRGRAHVLSPGRAMSEHDAGAGAGALPARAGPDEVAVGRVPGTLPSFTELGGSGFSTDLPPPWALRSETSSTTGPYARTASDGLSGSEEETRRRSIFAEEM